MTSDDDWILSAHMDGQLTPDEHHSVESAAASDPRVAETMRQLAVVSNLVAGLSRNATADVTDAVMRRIRRRPSVPTLRPILAALGPVLARPHRTWAAGGLAVAAMLLIAVAMPLTLMRPPAAEGSRNASRPGLDRNRAATSSTPSPTPDASEVRPHSFASHSDDGASDRLESGDPQSAEAQARSPEVVSSPSRDLEFVREYLEHPNLRRILLVADLDGTTQKQVASVVEQTTRFNFYRITISQGIVIDPRRPDRATVFALVVNDKEMETLCQRLKDVLHDRVEEAPVDPGVVTQLAELDRVQAFRPASALEIPRDELAFKHGGKGEIPRRSTASSERERDRPTPEQERSAPIPPVVATQSGSGGAAGRRKPSNPPPANGDSGSPQLVTGAARQRGQPGESGRAEEPDRNLVVLVWVSQPHSD